MAVTKVAYARITHDKSHTIKNSESQGCSWPKLQPQGWAGTRGIAMHTSQRHAHIPTAVERRTQLRTSNMHHHKTAVSSSFLSSSFLLKHRLCMHSQKMLVSQECVACESGRGAVPGVHLRRGETYTPSCTN